MLARGMIIALPLAVAFTASTRGLSDQMRGSSVALPAKNDGITEEISQVASATLLGLAIAASPIQASAVSMTDSITSSLQSSDLVISKVCRPDAPMR